MWWREPYRSDENLNDNHLMRMAGHFSRRLRAWAKANGVPVIYCSPGEAKHRMGEQHLATRAGNALLASFTAAPRVSRQTRCRSQVSLNLLACVGWTLQIRMLG